jgi:deoxyribonuclease-4
MASRRSSTRKKHSGRKAAKKAARTPVKKAARTPAKTAARQAAKQAAGKTAKKLSGKTTAARRAGAAPVRTAPEQTVKRSTRKPAFNPKTDSANDPGWVAPVWDDDVLLGAHVSIAGGTHAAPPRGRAIGATAMQIFTKMANRWAERLCETDECAAFRAAIGETRIRDTIAHDSYLINLASPNDILRRQSIESFVSELQRCAALGITYLVSHPGNYIDDRASGIRRNADAITEALARVGGGTVLCMETTAGSGTAIGSTFEDLAELIAGIPDPYRARVAVCVDTCHAYSAGYDLVNAYDDVWRRFDDVLGMERLKVMHLNDSKTPFDSRRDRHELIGEGSLGELAFRHVMNDERLARVPKVIETPKGNDPTATDARMLGRLRGYIRVE